MQARDFYAISCSRGVGVFDKLQDLMPFVYAILRLFTVRDYHNVIVLSQLHLAYLRDVQHPTYAALQRDHRLAFEEPGEASFSALSRSVVTDPNGTDYKHLSTAYKMTGLTRGLTRNYDENCGRNAGAQQQTHFDCRARHNDDVGALEAHLLNVAHCISTRRCFPRYRVGSDGVTATQIYATAAVVYAVNAPVYINERIDLTITEQVKHVANTVMENTMHEEVVAWAEESS